MDGAEDSAAGRVGKSDIEEDCGELNVSTKKYLRQIFLSSEMAVFIRKPWQMPNDVTVAEQYFTREANSEMQPLIPTQISSFTCHSFATSPFPT